MPELTFVRNDQEFDTEIQVLDADGEPVDLSQGVENVLLKAQSYQNLKDTFSISGTPQSGTIGWVTFHFTTELVGRHGEYYGEVQIQWATGKILTAPILFIHIGCRKMVTQSGK